MEDRLAYCTFLDHGGEGEKCVRTIANLKTSVTFTFFSKIVDHLTQKALGNAQHTGVDVVSEDVDDRGEICGQDARVDVKEVLEAVHVSAFYKVLSVFQFCQQAFFLSNPGEEKLVSIKCLQTQFTCRL